jgi:nitrate/nitrite transporter NarK
VGSIGCFAVWTIFAIIGVEIQRQYVLTDTEFGLRVGVPLLVGLADARGTRRLGRPAWRKTTFSRRELLSRRLVVHHTLVSKRASRHGAGDIGHGQCGLGGVVLPLVFGMMNDLTDVWPSCFMVLFGIGSG